MKRVRKSLAWSKAIFGDIFQAVNDAEKVVQLAEEKTIHDGRGRAEVFEARAKLKLCIAREEAFWRQKARVRWDLEGDRNTKYFHGCMRSKINVSTSNRSRTTMAGSCKVKRPSRTLR